jgi:hypothetical protein
MELPADMKRFGLSPARGQIGLRYAGIRADYDRLFDPLQAENMAFVKLRLDELGQQNPDGFTGTAQRKVARGNDRTVK